MKNFTLPFILTLVISWSVPPALAQPTGPGFDLGYSGLQYVTVSAGKIPTSGNFTVECWARAEDYSSFPTIIGQGGFYISNNSTNNTISLGDGWVVTAIPFPVNAWHHFAVVKAATSAQFYLDGVLVTNRTSTIPNPNPVLPELRFGSLPFGSLLNGHPGIEGYWQGEIDEVRIWNTARTQTQITNSLHRPLVGNEANLVSYYRFDEDTGGSTSDVLSGGGSFFNTPHWTLSTVPFVPGVITSNAINVSATNAVLKGNIYINPGTGPNWAWFDWGTTTNYGNQTPFTFVASGGPFTSSTNLFSATLSNLAPAQVYQFRLTGSNTFGLNFGTNRTFTTLSTNANLVSLTSTAGTFTPAFNSNLTSYAVSVSFAVTSVTVTPHRADNTATMQVRANGGTFVSIFEGNASGPLTINVGDNLIDVLVTAQDSSTKTYTITVTRAAPTAPSVTTQAADLLTSTNARLNGLVNPNGTSAAAYFEWGLSTNYGQSTFPVSLGSGSAPLTVSTLISNLLPATAHHFRIAATNAGGLSLGVDQTFVTLSTNADLVLLTSTGGALTPSFDPHTLVYRQTVASGSIVMLTATAADSNAALQMRVNGASWNPLVSGAASAPLVLNVGLNEADVLVTAQDGLTTKTYTNRITLFSLPSQIQGVWESAFNDFGTATQPFSNVALSSSGEFGSQVFVGSSSVVYAFDNTTGTRNWIFTATDTVNRPIATRLHNGTEAVFVTSHDGFVWGINAHNGAALWSAKDTKRKSGLGNTLCGNDGIVAPPAIQRYDDSNAAFRAAIGDDLLIVCTSYDGNCNSGYVYNRIYGIKASSGAIAWTFNLDLPANHQVDFFYGACTIDYTNNILYAACNQPDSRAQPTLWQISTLDGTLIASQNYGAIHSKPVLVGDRLYVANYDGTLFAISTNLLTEIWNKQITGTAYFSRGDPAVFRPCGSDENTVLVVDSTGYLHGVRDLGTSGLTAWPALNAGGTIVTPVIAWPTLGKAYFGTLIGANYWVHQLDLGTPPHIEAGLQLDPSGGPAAGLILDSSGPASDLRVDRLALTTPTSIEKVVIPWSAGTFDFAKPWVAASDKLRIIKSVSPQVVILGQPITYTLLVTNLDDTAFMTYVSVTDILPIGVTNAMAAASQGTVGILSTDFCADMISYLADSGVVEVPASGYQVRASVGILTNRTSATVTITTTPSQVGFLTNTAYVLSAQTSSSSTNCNSTAVVQVLDPTADDDGDGMSNLAEYLAGTKPLNSASSFRIVSLARQTNGWSVSWTTVGGHKYELQAAADLSANPPSGGFVAVSPTITMPGSGESVTNFVEIGAFTNSARYYRVRVVP